LETPIKESGDRLGDDLMTKLEWASILIFHFSKSPTFPRAAALAVHTTMLVSAGCFSWCPLRRWGAKKQTIQTEVNIDARCAISLTQVQECQLDMVTEVATPVPITKVVPESEEVSGFIHVLWILTSIRI